MPRRRPLKEPTNGATDWTEVIAKALAYLALHTDELKSKNVTERAAFLLTLGLTHEDAAKLLGSSEKSLRELLRRSAKKSGPGVARKRV